jgi:Acetyltransferase (GNAT) domain
MRDTVFKNLREIDPIRDPGWTDLIERHPRASIFHTAGWLDALRRTYGYEPVVLTTSRPSEQLKNGVVFCRVSSWLTGRRLVSLPFSDHCEPLVDSHDEICWILANLCSDETRNGQKYVEMRPVESDLGGFPAFSKAKTFCLHRLDLRPDIEDIFQGFHKDCVRRKILRAEREGLVYEVGRSDALLEKFYRMLVLTRQRQFMLPQPLAWFTNLIACAGDALEIHVVSKGWQPVASIMTLSHKSTVVYKYGCSDKRFNSLGGTHLIFWKVIQHAKARDMRELDLGRSEWANPGLVAFKDRWGALRSTLTYWRHGAAPKDHFRVNLNGRIAQSVVSRAPGGLLATTGALLYRHMG